MTVNNTVQEVSTMEDLDRLVEENLHELTLEISSILKSVRKEKKITQTKLAELTGLPQKTISRIEKGIAPPKIKTILTIAHVLDIEINFNFNTK